MRRILIIVLALTVVAAMTAPAMARKVKVPKSICWSYNNGNKIIAVALKKGTSIKFLDGKTAFYLVQGTQYNDSGWMPASGTAYVRNPTDQELVIHLVSDYVDFYSMEIYWDIDDKIGTVWLFLGSDGSENGYNLTEVACKTLDPTF